jgi:hypothetical protein
MEISLLLVVAGGVVLLLAFALMVGAGLDTEAQRREWQRVAEERRLLREERQDLRTEPLCDRCPYRRRAG